MAGILFDDRANRMTPSHCTKDGTRYRYYFSQATLRSTTGRWGQRVPAGELESLVVRHLSAFLASGKSVLDTVGRSEDTAATRKALVAAGRALAAELPKAPIPRLREVLLATIARVTLAPEWLELTLSRQGLRAYPHPSTAVEPSPQRCGAAMSGPKRICFTSAPRRGYSGVGGGALRGRPGSGRRTPRAARRPLIKAIARSYVWYERLVSGEVDSLRVIAKALRVNERYVGRVLRFSFLAPDIVAAILEGRQPPQLTVEKLRFGPPLLWAEQRKSFGFRSP